MDRIQAAIARARTAREAVLAGHTAPGPQPAAQPAVSPRPADPVPEPAKSTTDQSWDALQWFEPDPAHLTKRRIVTRESGPKSAPFDVLRTRALQQMSAQGWKRLAVTSPGPGCGKSTVTMNLAFSLARRPDIRTLVIDLDLRRPMLANLLGIKDRHEISSVIRGTSDARSQIVRVADNLVFATTRTPVHDPAELLQGRRIGDMLTRLEEDFAPDVILFDLPPMMVSDDAIAFMPNADCALMIAAAEQSTLSQVDICEKELAAQTSVLGVVLNKCNHQSEGQRYGYAYGSDVDG
ncbi:capsular exopolysaccharide family [Jannaschia faecimaris]|uniref:Capsular exopolysaccharide family n=1 Tax=Jannaschia faecimaris TaxID=1244108 RepID=A0A1H3IZW6_9RHOB|nr:CpsD/CapB family tyrosine-protein kinase [Jannaschia faecimaris]SDY33107.1 capsular exopolysaccharide family [Jannaschia faecimaris]